MELKAQTDVSSALVTTVCQTPQLWIQGLYSWIIVVEEVSLSRLMSCFRHDRLEGWDHSILINRLDTSWSLSLCPLYMTPNLGCATSCLISHFVSLQVTVSGSDWGDPLGISLRKACLMDETSSHLQSLLTTPVSFLCLSLSHMHTHRDSHTLTFADI